jgi:multidrug efflux pump subunit AcrB
VALLLGLFAVLVTPREEEPQINVTMANVLIPFPGASSADVQNMVARPAEQVLGQIAGIEHTYSVSRPGVAVLTVQFKVGVPRTEALVRLYDVLNANQDWLPRDLGTLPPIVKPKGIDDVPVLAVTLWSRDAPARRPRARGARWRPSSSACPARARCRPSAAPAAWCRWRSTRRAARARRRPAAPAADAGRANLGMPAGSVVDTPARPHAGVETGEFLRNADEVGDLVVGVHAGKPVYLREVARVEAGAAQPQRYVWFTPGAAAAGRQRCRRGGLPGGDAHRDQEAGRERGGRGARVRARGSTRCATP